MAKSDVTKIPVSPAETASESADLGPPRFEAADNGNPKPAQSESFKRQIFKTTGSGRSSGIRLLMQVAEAMPGPTSDRQLNDAAELMYGIAPQDALEGMLAAQMVSVHNMAMDYSRRAAAPNQIPEGRDRNIAQATKLMRTFANQVETLQKHRGKGQQTVTVQHVDVRDGGQAVVAQVGADQGGAPKIGK